MFLKSITRFIAHFAGMWPHTGVGYEFLEPILLSAAMLLPSCDQILDKSCLFLVILAFHIETTRFWVGLLEV